MIPLSLIPNGSLRSTASPDPAAKRVASADLKVTVLRALEQHAAKLLQVFESRNKLVGPRRGDPIHYVCKTHTGTPKCCPAQGPGNQPGKYLRNLYLHTGAI